METLKTGVADICLCYDSLTFEREAEHEIIHALSNSLGRGVMEGYMGIIGRGMNEALTENNNSKRLTYPQPRYVLNQILNDRPELEKLAYQAYFGNESRNKLTSAIFNAYGSEGVIKFDFMASTPIERNDKLGKSILFDTEECLRFFSEGVNDPYLEAVEKTREFLEKFEKISNICHVECAKNSKHKNLSENVQSDRVNYYAAKQICSDLSGILVNDLEVPLRDLFCDKWMLNDYNNLLKELQEFSFKEDAKLK